MPPIKRRGNVLFLSTLSLRRATQVFQRIAKPFRISIHALLAESDCCAVSQNPRRIDFYPRSPCGERPVKIVIIIVDTLFLSTLSLRRATFFVFWCILGLYISIHALLAESDLQRQIEFERYSDISIHALLAESDHFRGPAV